MHLFSIKFSLKYSNAIKTLQDPQIRTTAPTYQVRLKGDPNGAVHFLGSDSFSVFIICSGERRNSHEATFVLIEITFQADEISEQ